MHNSLASRLLVRLLLLFALVTVISIAILTKWGFDELTAQTEKDSHANPSEANGYNYALGARDAQIERLKHEVLALRAQIVLLQNNRSGNGNGLAGKLPSSGSGYAASPASFSAASSNNNSQLGVPQQADTTVASLTHHYDCSSYIRKQVGAAEILHGLPLNNEYEMIPFNHFTFTRVYPIDLGLGKRVVEKPIGYRRRDLLEAVNKALESLNRNHTARARAKGLAAGAELGKYTLDDFVEGIYRTEPTTGSQYELYFQSIKHQTNVVRKALVMRPFAPLQTVQLSEVAASPLIHVILPLAGRLRSFRSFMQMFGQLADRRLQLIVVYFGEAGLKQAQELVAPSSERVQLLALNETFSRAKALRLGAEHIQLEAAKSTEDALLFMCDVDIVFTAKFLERCRWNTSPGKKVE